MNENLNLVEILKDCPKGTKLYSTVFGDVEFHKIDLASDSTLKIYVKTWAGVIVRFHHSGKIELSCRGECTLFPSKDQRDWSKFKPKNEELVPPCEFKDGDILSYKCAYLKNRTIYIYRYHKTLNTAYYVALSGDTDSTFRIGNKGECALNGYDRTVRFATEEEKQKLFDTIKLNGYKWNAETKTLEKLVKPKFKVGDWVVFNGLTLYIKEVVKGFYRTISKGGIVNSYDWDIDNIARLWVIQDAKDGDVLEFGDHGRLVVGVVSYINKRTGKVDAYCLLEDNKFKLGFYYNLDTINPHPATQEQRDALMKAMNDAGYVWDEKKNELRELIKPKFDPKALQPFDRVLVKNSGFPWRCDIFSYYQRNKRITCHCISDDYIYDRCIPYNEDTKHLVGTTEEAPEFYRYWED